MLWPVKLHTQWPLQESNLQPFDYRSNALPIELSGQPEFWQTIYYMSTLICLEESL